MHYVGLIQTKHEKLTSRLQLFIKHLGIFVLLETMLNHSFINFQNQKQKNREQEISGSSNDSSWGQPSHGAKQGNSSVD